MGIGFQPGMLTWKEMTDEEKKQFDQGDLTQLCYERVLNADGFVQIPENSITEYSDLPGVIQKSVERALPLYNHLSQYKLKVY